MCLCVCLMKLRMDRLFTFKCCYINDDLFFINAEHSHTLQLKSLSVYLSVPGVCITQYISVHACEGVLC